MRLWFLTMGSTVANNLCVKPHIIHGDTNFGQVALHQDVIWFEHYQEASIALTEYKETGLESSIILKYADVLQSRYPHLPFHPFFDIFFTFLPLLGVLREKRLGESGTIRGHRIKNVLWLLKFKWKKLYLVLLSSYPQTMKYSYVDETITELPWLQHAYQ